MGTGNSRSEFTTTEEISLRASQALIAIVMIFSILTNAMVIRIFLSKKFGKITTAKILYANISFSDELFILTCIIQAFLYGSECNGHCRILLSYTTHISGIVSTYSMALIAVKRYQAIAFPMQNVSSTTTNCSSSVVWTILIPIGSIWAFAITMPIVFVEYVEVRITDRSFFTRICNVISGPVQASKDNPYFSLVAMVSVPLLIGLTFSLATIYSIHKTKVLGDNCAQQLETFKRRKLKSILTIFIILVTFAVCWLPVTIFYTIERLSYARRGVCDYNYNLFAWLTFLLMLEFGANPIIYWFMNADFKKGIKVMYNQIKSLKCNEGKRCWS